MLRPRGFIHRHARRPSRLVVALRTDTGRENQYGSPADRERNLCVLRRVNNVNLSLSAAPKAAENGLKRRRYVVALVVRDLSRPRA